MKREEREISLEVLGSVVEERLKNGQPVQMTVSGNSMFPLFRDKRDSVILSPVSGKIRTGDVMLYRRRDGQYVLHRVIRRKKHVYSANGDNQYWVETPLFREQFLGKMSGFYRKGEYRSVSSLWYRIYSFVWVRIRPFRGIVLDAWAKYRVWEKKIEKH